VESQRTVTPAEAGVHNSLNLLDSCWSLPRTCRLDPTTGYGAGMTKMEKLPLFTRPSIFSFEFLVLKLEIYKNTC
jgi:hypothetical protein